MTKQQRPVNLDLPKMKFPITAITSILHRVTGVLLFLSLPFLLLLLQHSISGEANFFSLLQFLSYPVMRFLIWLVMTVAGYHVIAGIRHLLMDVGVIPVSLCAGIASSWAVIVLSLALAVLAGVWVW